MAARKDLFGCPLVGQDNQIEGVRFLFSFLLTPLLWPPKREYNAVSATADGIWKYRMGGNLTIFDKDYDTAEIAKVLAAKAYGFATITLYSHLQKVISRSEISTKTY